MLFYYWAYVSNSDTALNQQSQVNVFSLLGTLEVRKCAST